MICEGSSTKSRGTPAIDRYVTRESIRWSAWPNSWKSVSTSSSERSAGVSPVGRVKFMTFVTIGRTSFPSFTHWSRRRPHQAPPRLPGRGW